jgi:8-oxo-dGTP pyrophosphatase MutT (NUDIX family)
MSGLQPSRCFIDHHGHFHQRPDGVTPLQRRGVHALIEHEARVLVVRPPDADWCELPGGGIESGESLPAALSRELREEAGLVIAPARLVFHAQVQLHNRYFSSKNGAWWVYEQHFVHLRLTQPPTLGEPLERGHEVRWLALEGLPSAALHHVHRHGVDRLLSGV